MNVATIRDLHSILAWVTVVVNGVAGAWCLGAHQFGILRLRAVWWLVVCAQVAIFLQVLLGVAMVSGYDLKAPEFHMFYGFVSLVAVALLYAYRNQLKPHLYLLYGFGGLFLMGLNLRSIFLA
jgi:hypothetical protein